MAYLTGQMFWRLYEGMNQRAHQDYLEVRLGEFEQGDPWEQPTSRQHGEDSAVHRCDHPECHAQNLAYYRLRYQTRQKPAREATQLVS